MSNEKDVFYLYCGHLGGKTVILETDCCNAKKVLSLILGAMLCCVLSAQTANFTQGEELFQNDQPEQAVPFLKKAVTEGNPKAYIYLSIAYYQVGKYQESVDICSAGMKANGTDKKKLAYNAGNSAFASGDYAAAEAWYT